MSDYGLRVSSTNVDATNLAFSVADLAQLPLNMRRPMAKLDTSKTVSFQNILLTFNTDPPEPTGAGEELITTVYSFSHGYTYAPAYWALGQVIQRPNSPGAGFQNYWQTLGLLRANTFFDYALLQVQDNDTNVFFNVRKQYTAGLGGSANNLIGCQVLVRVYLFVEDYNNET